MVSFNIALGLSVLSSILSVASAGVIEPPATCTPSAIVPKPTNYICGQQGTVAKPAVVADGRIPHTKNSDACALNCRNSKSCVSFYFNLATKLCQLLSKPIVQQQFKNSTTSKQFFWSRNCYADRCFCDSKGDTPTMCGDKCVNLSWSSDNCGACGVKCNSSVAYCNQSQCKCGQPGYQYCRVDAQCHDLQTDPKACGFCGRECSGSIGYYCVKGECSHTPN